MIDSHCHLSGTVERCGFSTLEELKTSAERWPEWTVDCGCEVAEIDRTVALCEAHPESMRFAVGIHPLEAESYCGEVEAKLVRLMSHPLCVAWGEIGLDLHGDGVPDLALQIEVCARQFAKAAALGKTITVHAREADERMLPLLKSLPAGHKVHLHCYTGGAEFLREVLALPLDLCVGFTGAITFPKNEALRQTVEIGPLERILVETDSPYLAPVPHRGRPCHPGYVFDTARGVAERKGVSFEEIDRVTSATARRLYGF